MVAVEEVVPRLLLDKVTVRLALDKLRVEAWLVKVKDPVVVHIIVLQIL